MSGFGHFAIQSISPYEKNSSFMKAHGDKIMSIPRSKMKSSMGLNVDTKNEKVPPQRFKHTYDDQKNKEKAKKEKKIVEKAIVDDDDSDYDIVIESITYV